MRIGNFLLHPRSVAGGASQVQHKLLGAWSCRSRKARSSFFEKKEPKKTFIHLASVWGEARQFEALGGVWGEEKMMGCAALTHPTTGFGSDGRQVRKVFLVLFFQKKNCLPSCH
jgi:hypothetical protein